MSTVCVYKTKTALDKTLAHHKQNVFKDINQFLGKYQIFDRIIGLQ